MSHYVKLMRTPLWNSYGKCGVQADTLVVCYDGKEVSLTLKMISLVGNSKFNLRFTYKMKNEKIIVVVWFDKFQGTHMEAKKNGPLSKYICGLLARYKNVFTNVLSNIFMPNKKQPICLQKIRFHTMWWQVIEFNKAWRVLHNSPWKCPLHNDQDGSPDSHSGLVAMFIRIPKWSQCGWRPWELTIISTECKWLLLITLARYETMSNIIKEL